MLGSRRLIRAWMSRTFRGAGRLDVQVEFDVDPLELAILALIKQSITDPKDIAEYLNVDVKSVEDAIKELKEKGLITEEEKNFLFFKSRTYKLTRKGYNTLITAIRKLKPQLLELKNILEREGEESAIRAMEAMGLGLLAPLLLPLLLGGLVLPFFMIDTHDGVGGHDPHIPPGDPF